jgi:hypothetical protein
VFQRAGKRLHRERILAQGLVAKCKEVLPSNWQELNKSVVPLSAEDDKKVLVVSLPVKTVCAWCKTIITEGVLVNGNVSHGICVACAKKQEIAEIVEREIVK